MQYISWMNSNKISIITIKRPKEIGISISKNRDKPSKLMNSLSQLIKNMDGDSLLMI